MSLSVKGDQDFSQSPEVFNRKNPVPTESPLKVQEKKSGRGSPVAAILSGPVEGVVNLANGQVLSLGSPLRGGEKIKGGEPPVRIGFPDGSQVLVPEGGEVEIHKPTSSQAPVVGLQEGTLRALVQKKIRKTSKGHSFFVRTRSVTMGVRGTDFVVETSDRGTTVHTLTGEVEVATDWGGLESGRGMAVGQGKMAEGRGGRIGEPQSFSLKTYVGQMNQRFPGMQTAWRQAGKDAKSGKVESFMRGMGATGTRGLESSGRERTQMNGARGKKSQGAPSPKTRGKSSAAPQEKGGRKGQGGNQMQKGEKKGGGRPQGTMGPPRNLERRNGMMGIPRPMGPPRFPPPGGPGGLPPLPPSSGT